MKKYIVTLTEEECRILGELTSKGEHKSQKILDALTLLGCDEGEFQKKRSTNEEISRVLSSFLCKIFIGQFFEERQVLTHFSYRV